MADVKGSGLPVDTALDDTHYVTVTDPTGSSPVTRRMTLLTLRTWLASIAGWISTAMLANSAVTPPKISNPYRWSVWQNTNPAVNNATIRVPHNQELYDTNNNFDTALNRYTVPVSGVYLINLQAQTGSAGMGTNEAGFSYIYKNGVELRRSQQLNGSGDSWRIVRSAITSFELLTAGDYIEHYITLQGVRDVSGGSSVTWFQGALISVT